MVKKEANLTAIMLVQQLEDTYWETWEDKTPIKLARDGNCKPLLQVVVDKLNNENISVKETLPSFKTPILSSSTCQLSSLPVPTSRGHRQPCCEPSYDSYKWW